MAKPTQPWTDRDEQTRLRLLEMAKARGVTQTQLAKVAGASQPTFHRWTKGKAHIRKEQLRAIELFLAPHSTGVDPEIEDSPMSNEAIAQVVSELNQIAGNVPAEESDPFRYLARLHSAAVFGQAFRLMACAKSEAVRARMVEFLKESGFGKAIQAFVDQTPKPPMEDAEFLDVLQRLTSQSPN